MNRSQIVPLGLTLLCITSIGLVGTTLDSSLTTDPADEIDLNYDRLPIGTSDAAAIQEEMDNRQDGDPVTNPQLEEAEGTGTQISTPTLLERLLALLEAILRLLLPLAAVLAVVVSAYYYRDRILALLRTALSTGTDRVESRANANVWPGVAPSNAVDQAWLWMVQRARPERPATKTPTECARIAREAGMDPSAVEAITDAFERVHYGGVPVERETARAQAALEQLRSDSRRQPSDGRPRRYGSDN